MPEKKIKNKIKPCDVSSATRAFHADKSQGRRYKLKIMRELEGVDRSKACWGVEGRGF